MTKSQKEKEILESISEIMTGDRFSLGVNEYNGLHDLLSSYAAFIEGESENTPMGVSQWLNYGEKWHYAEFFREKWLAELKKQVEGMKLHIPEQDYEYFCKKQSATIMQNDLSKNYNQALDDVLLSLNDKLQ